MDTPFAVDTLVTMGAEILDRSDEHDDGSTDATGDVAASDAPTMSLGSAPLHDPLDPLAPLDRRAERQSICVVPCRSVRALGFGRNGSDREPFSP